jgi:hypothetical protein
MMKRIGILALFLVLALQLMGCSNQTVTTPASTTSPPASTTVSSSPVSNTVPASVPVITEATPLYGWSYEGEVMRGICDPTIITLADNSYRMYYGSFKDWTGPEGRDPFIGSAVSKDGLVWTDEGDRGLTGGWPRIIKLQDGRYRMYYGGAGGIAIAVSTDGLSWQNEKFSGIIFTDTVRPSGLDVVQLTDDTYRMYFSESAPSAQFTMSGTASILSAVSADGLAWQQEDGLRIDYKASGGPCVNHPRVLTLSDGTYKMYFWNAGMTIMSAVSKDGLTWSGIKSESIMGADPDIVVLPDGRQRMYCNLFNSAAFGTGRDAQRMWIYTLSEQPFTLTVPAKLDIRPGQSTEMEIKINGFSSAPITLEATVLYGQLSSDQLAVTLDKSSGTAPFSVNVQISDPHGVLNSMFGILITATDGVKHIQLLIPRN